MTNGTEGSGRRITAKQVLVGVLLVIVVVLAVVNLEDAEVDFVVGTVTLPLVVVIVGSALIGWIIGWFTARRND